jgi:hypothetical protein
VISFHRFWIFCGAAARAVLAKISIWFEHRLELNTIDRSLDRHLPRRVRAMINFGQWHGQHPQLLTAILVRAAWQRSPGKLAQVLIQKTPGFQGRTRARVETSGIRAISATGTEAFYPWATIGQVWETTRSFHLLDHDGRVRAILPKRALDSPDLLPALRTFLTQAVAQQPPAMRVRVR